MGQTHRPSDATTPVLGKLTDIDYELSLVDLSADVVWQQNMFKCIDASACVLIRAQPPCGTQYNTS